jgi:acetylornithine deacetylase
LNVGRIEGGGAANVIADAASAEVLFRVVGEAAEIEAALRARMSANIRVDVVAWNDALVLEAPAGYVTDVVPFNTDAPYLRVVAPVVLCGPGDIRCAHSPDERINFEEFDEGVRVYVRLAGEFLGRD